MFILRRIANYALSALFARELRRQLRLGSVKAVKAYVGLVGKVRLGALMVFAMALAASAMFAGLCMVVAGAVWWIAAGSAWPPIALFSTGGVLLIATGAGAAIAFSQKRWLEMSGANRMIEAVVRNGETPKIADRAAMGLAARAANLAVPSRKSSADGASARGAAKAAKAFGGVDTARSAAAKRRASDAETRLKYKQPRQPQAPSAREMEGGAPSPAMA